MSQRKIAEAIGVSVMTVSRALRDHPDLASDTKAKIIKMAQEMGYTGAKIQAEASSKAAVRRVAVIAFEPRESKRSGLDSDVLRAIFLSLQRECQSHGIETVIELAVSGEAPRSLANRTVDGAFIFGRYTRADTEIAPDIPKLAISSYISDHPLSRVVADNACGSRLSTDYLISLGHRNIVFFGAKDPLTELYQERADGYATAMVRAGLTPRIHFVQSFSERKLLGLINGCTAVVASSDSGAYQLITFLEGEGVAVPGELSVVGFDNLRALFASDKIRPAMELTTYGPDWSLMGKLAANTLLFRKSDLQGPPFRLTVPGRLHIGESTARQKRSAAS